MLQQQVSLFLASLLAGILFMFGYDWLRILRVYIPHGKWLCFVEDYLYWMLAGVVVFLLMVQMNDGAIRGFALGGIGLGMVLYYNGPSAWVIAIFTWVPKKVRKLKKASKKRRNNG